MADVLDKMRPCPFCKAKPPALGVVKFGRWWRGICNECTAQGPFGKDEADAVKQWNGKGEKARN